IHCLVPFSENIERFKSVFEKYHLLHRIYFARKANKCLAFARQSFSDGHGVDTASFQELQECLDAGIDRDKLILTAAVKSASLLDTAVRNGVTVVLDNTDECRSLQQAAASLKMTVPVNVRLGGFTVNGKKLPS